MSEHHMHDHNHLGEHPEADAHGMLLVGEDTLYLSHFPMFHHPHHNVQAIIEISLTDGPNGGSAAQTAYVTDRRTSGERLYTLVPEPFVLLDLVTPPPGEECVCEFTADVYRGHFERFPSVVAKEAARVVSGVRVIVQHVVHFQQFDPAAEKPTALQYLLFGKGRERFLAHLITRPPDFDQVVSVQVTGRNVSDEELRLGPTVTIAGRENTISQRLRSGDQASGTLMSRDPTPAQLKMGTEYYLEEGELAEEFDTGQTPEEKTAGF